MEFSLFAHMERISPDQDQKQLYEEFVELCKTADEGGMRAVWTGEHHGMNFTISPNPFLNLVDVARHTQNVRLGTGTIIAPFWHPIRLAGEAAMTDIITDGRLELGIARGAYTFEYERLMPGLEAWEAGQRMRELVPAVKALWAGDYAHEGEFYSFPMTTAAPLPQQEGGPPIWIAAREANSHEFAIKNGCNVQVTPLWNGDDEDAKLGAVELNRFYNYFGAWFMNKRKITQGLIAPLSDEDIAAHPFFNPEALERDLVVATADKVIGRLKIYEELGYDEYFSWIDSSMSFERKKASLERFISDVMPAFK